MNRFNTFIEKRNFKRIFIIYIIAAVICGIFCAGAVGYVFRDKIGLALQYEKTSEAFEKGSSSENLRQSIDSLADSSGDIVDVLLLDDKNNVTYSAKNTKLAWDSVFELNKSEIGSRFLVSGKNSDAAFRYVKKDEFMLRSVFANDFNEIHEEYDEEYFYLNNFQNKKLYMLSLLGKDRGGAKAYVISDPKPVLYGMMSLKVTASIIMLLFMIYWIIIALWVYQNARKSKLSAPVWGIITLFTNLAGVLVYAIYKHINGVCAFCGAVQSKGNVFCTFCGKTIGTTCEECGHSLKATDNYCPKCGHKRG